MSEFLYIILAVSVVSIISFVGVFTIPLGSKRLKKLLLIFVSFAVGTMLGAAFLDLLPDAASYGRRSIYIFPLLGIVSFFILEKFIFWHHRHEEKEAHAFTYLNLIGDGIHNFIDGIAIAASFLHSVPLGIATTVAIIFHEIPQEIGDFGVLIYGGFSRMKALVFNFISALTAVVGGVVGYLFLSGFSAYLPFLLAFTAGNFIYIAGVDLLPELRKERSGKTSLIQLASIIIGILFMWIAISVVE